MCVCAYVCPCVYMCAHVPVCAHVCACMCSCTCVLMCMHMCPHVHVCAHTCLYVPACACTRARACAGCVWGGREGRQRHSRAKAALCSWRWIPVLARTARAAARARVGDAGRGRWGRFCGAPAGSAGAAQGQPGARVSLRNHRRAEHAVPRLPAGLPGLSCRLRLPSKQQQGGQSFFFFFFF